MSDSASPGLFARLRGAAASGVAIVRTRLELLRLEAQAEAARLVELLVWSFAAVLCGVAAVVFLAVFVTVLLWESHRLLALGIASALFLSATAVSAVLAWRRLKQGSQLFAASLAELRADEAALKNREASS